MSVKSGVKVNFPVAENLMLHPPRFVKISRFSFSSVVLELEWSVVPEQPFNVSTPARRTGRVADRPFGTGSAGVVSIELGADAGSAIRGAAAASGTTTAIAASHAGRAARADSVSR